MNIYQAMYGVTPGFNPSPINYFSRSYQQMAASVAELEEEGITKALVTGQGIVQGGDTGGRALRVQFLHDLLTAVSFQEKHAVGIKLLPTEKAYSPTFEWSTYNQYGSSGHGFQPETGSDGAFGLSASDDNFARQVINLGYLAALRQVSLVSQSTKNITDPIKTARIGATRELLAKANQALYWGDAKQNAIQFNGLIRQIQDWATANSQDSMICYDAGGSPVGASLLEDALVVNKNVFGEADLLLMSTTGYGDTSKLLFPFQRVDMGTSSGSFGVNKRQFEGPYGEVKIADDPMLRINRPLVIEGTGNNGLPRATADANAPTFTATNPWTTAPTVISPGTGPFTKNATDNTDTGQPTVPAAPSGSGNNQNRLAANTYYYAVSLVTDGYESLPWAYGASASNTLTGATGLTPNGSQIVQMQLAAASVTNLGGTLSRNRTQFRIYRYTGSTAPTAFSQFSFLMNAGVPTAGDAYAWDNGMYMAGTDNAFLITRSRDGNPAWMLLQLLPLMERELPHYAMGDPVAYLWFICAVLLAPRHHIWVRNIGRAS